MNISDCLHEPKSSKCGEQAILQNVQVCTFCQLGNQHSFFKRNIYNIYHSQEIWKNVWVESLWKCLSAGRQVFSAVEGWQVNVQHINGWTLAHDTYRCIIGVFEELWTMKNWFVRMYLCKFNLYSPFQSEDFDHWCSIIYHMILNSNAPLLLKQQIPSC